MSRETTFNEIRRDGAVDDAAATFVMDEETFRAFYERTARGVWAYLGRLTGDRQLADDLLQEAYYRFLRSDGKYDSETHRRNALYRIATNLARDAWRRNLARTAWSVTGNDIEQVSSSREAGSTERTADLTRAMAHLTQRERAMLWLAYAEGATHREIAEVLGVRAGSLKPMLFRARRKLAGLLGRTPGKETA